ncbi:MAG: tetratricopeptide repeat protein [Myxococcota bacterium]
MLNQWEPAESARSKLAAAGERCIHLAPHAAEGFLLGRYHQTRGDHAAAIEVLETAIAKNPSFAVAHALLAQALNLCGRSDEGLVRMQHALRLGPRSFVAGLATLHFSRGEFGAALECAERAIAITPRYTFARVIAAAAAWRAGEVVRGRDHLAQLRAMYPAFDPRGFLATFGVGVQAVEQVTDALHQLEALVAIGR